MHVLYHNKNIGFITFHRLFHTNKNALGSLSQKLSLQHNYAIHRPISKNYRKRVNDMKKKIVIAGGTGFVGQHFEEKFTNLGYEIIIISRRSDQLLWTDNVGIVEALEGAEMLINLAGKSVNCRYNEKNKKEILDSRTETTEILGNALLACKNPPSLWINSSYGYDLSTCGRSTYDGG